MRLKVAALTGMLIVVSALPAADAEATDDDYRYKFPCVPADACYVTTLTHTGNAYDFDPQGSAGLGSIPAVSEGTFVQYFTQSDECTTSGLGMYAEIQDMHGRTLKYAHLSSFGGLQVGGRVLQGDIVGIEGNTGYTINCAPHLHLEGIAGQAIDGNSSIGLGLYQSTNSIVGAYNLPAAAIRQKYFDLGNPYTSWASVGWTADWTGTQNGCNPNTYCRLYVHYVPNPVTGHWGSTQTFRRHPGTARTDDNAIMVGRWAVNDAYRADRPFFAAWLYSVISLPVRNPIGTSSPRCPSSEGCVAYQRFHLGFVWQHSTLGVQPSVFCPDVSPYYPNMDYIVTIQDILAVTGAYFDDDPAEPYQPWYDSWHDINGDGIIRTADYLAVIGQYFHACYADLP